MALLDLVSTMNRVLLLFCFSCSCCSFVLKNESGGFKNVVGEFWIDSNGFIIMTLRDSEKKDKGLEEMLSHASYVTLGCLCNFGCKLLRIVESRKETKQTRKK